MDSILDNLPTEILQLIIGSLQYSTAKSLSMVGRRFRVICAPIVFRRVKFEFTLSGFHKLESLTRSPIRMHVVSFTYVVPELLRPEIIDFDDFMEKVLSPQRYVGLAKDWYDVGYPVDDFPSYLTIYDTAYEICKQQRAIVNNRIDQKILSASLQRLPKLEELEMFFDGFARGGCLESRLHLGLTIKEKSAEHHLRVVANAVREAADAGIRPHSIRLSHCHFPRSLPWGLSNAGGLLECLCEMLQGVPMLALQGRGYPLELLSGSSLGLRHLDLRHLKVSYACLEGFLVNNAETLRSVASYNVRLNRIGQRRFQSVELAPRFIRSMVKERKFTVEIDGGQQATTRVKRWKAVFEM